MQSIINDPKDPLAKHSPIKLCGKIGNNLLGKFIKNGIKDNINDYKEISKFFDV